MAKTIKTNFPSDKGFSKDELNAMLSEMNKATDNTPIAYMVGREFCGVLFYLFAGSVRSLVFRRLLSHLVKILDESDPQSGFGDFLGRCMQVRVSDIFSQTELDNYFHVRVSKELDIEKMEE